MKLPIRLALAGAAAVLALAGCGPKAADQPQPPEIAYGQDLCEACGMLIDSPQFAAAAVTTAGGAHKFDDLAEMILYHQEHPEEQVRAWFVHDYESEAWIRAETAFFVEGEAIHSPMGHGLAAFETEAAAQRVADQVGSVVLSFDTARAEVLKMDHSAHN